MFDKLIESNSEGAEFKNRRSYFMVSTVFVGILFLAAVVASIYAGEIGIGNGDLDLSELLAPVEMAAAEPESPQPRQQPQNQQTSDRITRVENQQLPDETPVSVPPISTTQNSHLSRPPGFFDIDLRDSGSAASAGNSRNPNGGDPNEGGLAPASKPQVQEPDDMSNPPPAIKAKPVMQSLGVINGKASYLPIPVYPAVATALNLQGKVDVQVTIDESGKVISAKAASGHPLLRPAAEKAAWGARFTPTLLSKVPVKVTGVIVYNFTRN
ncbi:MAG: TonB family protein [Pyrinomonadaceae bacterium]